MFTVHPDILKVLLPGSTGKPGFICSIGVGVGGTGIETGYICDRCIGTSDLSVDNLSLVKSPRT